LPVCLGAALAALLALPAAAEDVTEPRSGVSFAAGQDGMSLLGTAVRTRTMLSVKVYAIGLYVSDEALSGPLAAFKGKTATREFYQQLIWGDFRKQVVMKFVRTVSRDQIQGAFRETLGGADKARLETFLAFFGDTKSGEAYVLRWEPGQGLLTTVAGQQKAPIDDKNFGAAVFGIWLGDKPIQDDIKRGLISRTGQLLR
jgi:hypothetical protein